MCTGLELAAIAVVAGGTGYAMNKRADSNLADKTRRIMAETDQQTNALKMVRQAEQDKQAQLQNEANQQMGQTIEGFSSEKQKRQIEEQQAKATQALQLSPEFIQATSPVTTTDNPAPAVVQDAINRRLEESAKKAGANAERFGALQGFDASGFMNNLALTALANKQATSGVLSKSSKNVADEASQVSNLVNSLGQGRIDLWTKQNATGGVRQAAKVADTVRNAALFAALTGGIGAAGNTGAIGTESAATPGTFGAYGPQPANARMIGGANPSFGGLF